MSPDPTRAPAEPDAPQRSTRRARWGMLAVAVAMGVALVAVGVTNWLDSRAAATSVAEARAMDLFRGVRRGLRDLAESEGVDGAKLALPTLLEDFGDAGLRYVGLVTRRGEVVAEAGERLGATDPSAVDELSPGGPGGIGHGMGPPEPRLSRVADRVRLEAPVAPGARMWGRGLWLVLEVEPALARRIEAAARAQLVVSGAVALALMGLTLVFWRLARRADRVEAELARDRRLAALGEMSAVLGHELRNPLASLKGHAQLVLERMAEGDRSRKNAERVVAESQRLERLMNEILDFARNGALELGEHDPVEVCEAAVAAVGDGRVRLDTGGAPRRWRLDRVRMEQVLVNVVRNACDATGDPSEGAVRVQVGEGPGGLVFEVRDRGPGFEPDAAGGFAHVFTPFRTSKVKGTGLGLAIARRIVEAHGGRITADNAPEGGARVRVVLPGAGAAPEGRG